MKNRLKLQKEYFGCNISILFNDLLLQKKRLNMGYNYVKNRLNRFNIR